MHLIKLVMISGLLMLLSGCGLKYDLYMPEDGRTSDSTFLIYSSEDDEQAAEPAAEPPAAEESTEALQ